LRERADTPYRDAWLSCEILDYYQKQNYSPSPCFYTRSTALKKHMEFHVIVIHATSNSKKTALIHADAVQQHSDVSSVNHYFRSLIFSLSFSEFHAPEPSACARGVLISVSSSL
jgi:hypothetical protein